MEYLKLEKLIGESENLLKIYNNELETDSNLPNILEMALSLAILFTHTRETWIFLASIPYSTG
ncbi:MAG: hypothetical protein IPH57_08290 [Saprospiraceae bacterium]|nr:hypothetical protein [Saprospiraceae bacterium]